MAEEAAFSTATETVISVLAVRFVGDDAIVASFLNSMGDYLGPSVGHALADLRHGPVLIVLHLGDALNCLRIVAIVVILALLLLCLKGIVLHHLHESFALTGSGRLIILDTHKKLLRIQSESHHYYVNLPLLSWALAAAWLRWDGVATDTAYDGVTDGALDLYKMNFNLDTIVK